MEKGDRGQIVELLFAKGARRVCTAGQNRRKARGELLLTANMAAKLSRGPSGQLNNFSLTGAEQHLFATRRSIINRLMWISNLLPPADVMDVARGVHSSLFLPPPSFC